MKSTKVISTIAPNDTYFVFPEDDDGNRYYTGVLALWAVMEVTEDDIKYPLLVPVGHNEAHDFSYFDDEDRESAVYHWSELDPLDKEDKLLSNVGTKDRISIARTIEKLRK